MKYAIEMGSGAQFQKKIGSGIKNFIRGSHRHTDSMEIL
jgi:hypothetical protein